MNRIAFVIRFLALSLLASPLLTPGAETEGLPAPAGRTEETNSQEMLRSYLQLQEQLHATQLAIERSREETDAAATRSAKALAERLQALEQAVAAQRARELDAVQSVMQNSNETQAKSNRVMLVMAGSFATVGFVALVVMAFFLWRTIQRLAEMSAALPSVRTFNPRPAIAALGTGETNLVTVEPAEQASQRLFGAIDRIEKRIREMEHTARPPLEEPVSANHDAKPNAAPSNGATASVRSNGNGAATQTATEAASAEDTGAGQVTMWLGKGQSMLNLDDAASALACFEKVLALEPANTEALVKKGCALEKLRRLDAALECYDQAIASDSSMTIAYLYKGGLLNRLERFNEALECYEKALRTQEKRVV